MTEMIDGVAEAICRDLGGQWQVSKDWPAGKLYRHLARAAIRAMRDPTDAMLSAAVNCFASACAEEYHAAWQAMIDVALGEKV